MAFIDIDYLESLGYRIPQSSTDNVETLLNELIESGEETYLQNTIGYSLTTAIYALVDPLPDEVSIFLNGNWVDGDEYYKGVLIEISAFIMAMFYGQLGINVNNSGFSSPVADGENTVAANFVVNGSINYTKLLRSFTYQWLQDNNTDFFEDWDTSMFKQLDTHPVW